MIYEHGPKRERRPIGTTTTTPNSLWVERSWGIARKEYEMLAAQKPSASFATDVWRAEAISDELEIKNGRPRSLLFRLTAKGLNDVTWD